MIRRRFAVSQTRRESRACPALDAIDDLAASRGCFGGSSCMLAAVGAFLGGVRWAELCRRARRSRTTPTRDHRLALRALAAAEMLPVGNARFAGKMA